MLRTFFILIFFSIDAFAQVGTYELTLSQAEQAAVATSSRLKASTSDHEAARHQTSAQFQTLLPKLSFQATYQYFNEIPSIRLGNGPEFPFGTNNTYVFGPSLNYTLWDTFSGRKIFQSYSLVEKARDEDRKSTEIQLLASVRAAYLQVQLNIEELRLIYDSLELARAQERDVTTRFRAGAATRLDQVSAQRSVLNYQIQFKQRQAQLAASLKDLLAFMDDTQKRDISKPGPPGIPGVSLVLRFEALTELMEKERKTIPLLEPGDEQPQIRSQLLQAEAFQKSAESQNARLYPTVNLSAGVTRNRPNIPNPPSYWQETVAVSLSVPLFLGDPTRELAAQQVRQSESSQYRAHQLRIDMQRDFVKAQELLQSYLDQRELAAKDVVQSQEAARLYYISYKAGKINFIDVQNSNLQALNSRVSAARIDAQILNQIIILKSISSQELSHD
jgi:outer membrane protein TolC